MTRGAALVGALGALALAGCTAVGPDYAGPPAGAVARTAAAAGPFVGGEPVFSRADAPADWWRLYQDPRLDDLIRQAFAANTDLRVAAANLERSQALLREARVARQPGVALRAGAGYAEMSGEAHLIGRPLPPNFAYDASFDVSYEVDLFGRLRRGVEAASAQDEAVQAAYDLVRVTVAADVARAYADACGAGAELAVARRSLALQAQSAQATRRLRQAGRATDLDVARTSVQVAQLQAALPTFRAAQRNALFRLAALTGAPPAAYPPDVEGCAVPPRLDAPLPVGNGAGLLRRRPDIRAAEREIAAATARVGVATADLYPAVRLDLSAISTGLLADALSPATNGYRLIPGLSWRLNRNAARARIAGANADVTARVARFDGVVLNALRETESALNTYAEDSQREAALETARRQAGIAAGHAERLYRAGKTDFLSLLDAQRSQASAESVLAAAWRQLSDDQVAVFLALGGGWESAASARPARVPPPPGALAAPPL
ncbi:efflux transporter outer membrane subunit [Phenylobacterium sp.]|uniref:efflux transporter outer membrane subunit n=1 Tax=Phenylobacterium sp. TaxID=1871053 RepID=UPI002F422BB0